MGKPQISLGTLLYGVGSAQICLAMFWWLDCHVNNPAGWAILAEDSTKVTLSPDELPLMAATAEKGGMPISGQVLGEVLTAKLDFTIGTSKKRKCIIHCTAERGKVRIRMLN